MADLRGGSTLGNMPLLGKAAPDNSVGKVSGNKIIPSSITDDGSIVTITNPVNAAGGMTVGNFVLVYNTTTKSLDFNII
ncbi:hypothetical protein D3C87_80450 [compost metagenome]